MSAGASFSAFLQTALDCRAVWPPIVTPLQLGDFGVVVAGLFRRLGNIAEFAVDFEVDVGRPSSLNVTSRGVALSRFGAGAPVASFQGLGRVSAALTAEFGGGDSFMLKTQRVERREIRNLEAVGQALEQARTVDGRRWRTLAWRLVWQVYWAHDVLFLATRERGTTVRFEGEAGAVQALDLGRYTAGVGVQVDRSLGVQILGDDGPIGYNLARLKLFGGIAFSADPGEAAAATQVEALAPSAASDPEPGPDDDDDDDDTASDEPADWQDIEADATDPRDVPADPLVFADEPISDASRTHWLQDCLRRLVDPGLAVDGVLGPRTHRAIKTFQRRDGRLTADGIAGPRTIEALESATGSRAPASAPPPAPAPSTAAATPPAAPAAPAQPAVAGDELRVHEVDGAGGPQYIVSSRDDEVRFSYWAPGSRHGVRGAGDGFDLDAYREARVGLLTAADYAGLGRSPSAIKIFRDNALKESGGKFGAINTWDNQLVSWGIAQFAGRAGTLAALLADLMTQADSRAAYQRFFAANGLTVEYGTYTTRSGGAERTLPGWHVVVRADDGPRSGDAGWAYVRSQPRLLGAFMLAGNDRSIQLGQVRFWLTHFLDRALAKVVVRDHAGAHAISQYLTSEYALGLIARLYNWMPAYVLSWYREFTAELARKHPDVDISDPQSWDRVPALEPEFTALMLAKRKAVKKGSYDTYGRDLDRARGSYVKSADPGR